MGAKPPRAIVKFRDAHGCPSCAAVIKTLVNGCCPVCLALVRPPRRAKLSAKERRRKMRALLRRDPAECRNCGATEGLTIDHIVPQAVGGGHALSNLQFLCEDCNQRKADR